MASLPGIVSHVGGIASVNLNLHFTEYVHFKQSNPYSDNRGVPGTYIRSKVERA